MCLPNATEDERLLQWKGLSKNGTGVYIITLRINGTPVHSEKLMRAK